jgi:hypothetical protein
MNGWRRRPGCGLRLSLLVFFAIVLAGCVTRADQRASQADLHQLERLLGTSDLANMDPDEFKAAAEQMVKTPIEYHGRVVDESGEPLNDIRVEAVVFDRLVDPFAFPFFTYTETKALQTNRRGRFVLKGVQGAGMYVLVDVPGYRPINAPRRLYAYAEGLMEAETFPSADTPDVFQFEPRPPEQALRRIRTGALPLPGDGEPLELSVREVAPYGVEPGSGEALVTCDRAMHHAAPHERFDWWCELTIPSGGVQATTLEMDRAPDDGYQETMRFSYPACSAEWDDRDSRELIIRFADDHYGLVMFSMRMDGDFYVTIDGIWNPSGSNWLD